MTLFCMLRPRGVSPSNLEILLPHSDCDTTNLDTMVFLPAHWDTKTVTYPLRLCDTPTYTSNTHLHTQTQC